MGKYPISCRAFKELVTYVPFLSTEDKTTNVMVEHIMQLIVTDCVRPLMTEGASRDRLGEGRVVDDM